MMRRFIPIFSVMALCVGNVVARDSDIPHLHHDPFKRPELQSAPVTSDSSNEDHMQIQKELHISSILVSGSNSMVTIQGKIMKTGEVFKGYTIKSIAENEVIFMRKGKQFAIKLNGNADQ